MIRSLGFRFCLFLAGTTLLYSCGSSRKGDFSSRLQELKQLTYTYQAKEANGKADKLTKELTEKERRSEREPEYRLRLQVQQAALFGLETQYSIVDKKLRDIGTGLDDNGTLSPTVKAQVYNDIAEAYLLYGYGGIAKAYLEKARRIVNPRDGGLDHEMAVATIQINTLLLGGDNKKALDLIRRYDKATDSLCALPANAKNKELKETRAGFLVQKMRCLVAMQDWVSFTKEDPIVSVFLRKNLKDQHHLMFHYWKAKGKAMDEQDKLSDARRAYIKALESLGGSQSYPKRSYQALETESELIGMLYSRGKQRTTANRVANVSMVVDKFFENIPEYEALRSLTFLREYASQGKIIEAYNEIKAIQKMPFGSYGFSPQFAVKINEVNYKIALQYDSMEEANRLMRRQQELATVIGGRQSPYYASFMLEYQFQQALNLSKWRPALDSFKRYYPTLILPNAAPASANKILLQDMYARCLEETEQSLPARQLLTDAQRTVKSDLGETSLLYASQLEKLAGVELTLGAYLQSQDHLKKALEIVSDERYKRTPVYLSVMRGLVKLNLVFGDYDEAEDRIKEALKTEREVYLGPALHAEESDELKPFLSYMRGRYRTAESEFQEQIAYYQQRGDIGKSRMIQPLTYLGQTYLELGDYPAAEKALREAMDYARRLYSDTSKRYYQCMAVQQRMLRLMGATDRSLALAKQVLAKNRRAYGNNHIEVAQALTELALTTYMKTDSATVVEPMLLDARKIYLDNFTEEHLLYAEANKNLAALYLDMNQPDKAEEMLKKAAAIYQKKLGRRPVQLADVQQLVGDLNLKRKNWDAAIDYYEKAGSIITRNLGKMHPKAMNLLGRKGRALALQNEPTKALRTMKEASKLYLMFYSKYFPYLSEREKALVWKQSGPDFEFYKWLCYSEYKNDEDLAGDLYNLELATKGILLSNSQGLRNQVMASKNANLILTFKRWQQNKELMATQLSEGDEGANGVPSKLEQETELLEKQLAELNPAFAQFSRSGKPAVWKEVRSMLKPGEYAVELVRTARPVGLGPDSIAYMALITSAKASDPVLVPIPNGRFLENKAIKYYRNGMKFNVRDSLSYEWFWRPLKAALPNGSRVYLSAEGVYNQINPGGFLMHSNTYLADSLDLVMVTSTRELVVQGRMLAANQKRKGPVGNLAKSAIVVANPKFYDTEAERKNMATYGLELKPLPGTEREAEAIKQVLTAGHWTLKTYDGASATEEVLRMETIPSLLHIGTHGIFQEDDESNPTMGMKADAQAAENSLLRVGLVLAGGGSLINPDSITNLNQRTGILTAYEAMNLSLSNTELVVLSACETGAGLQQNGEGVYGLQRAFLVAGAQNVVFSLFKVDDKATAKLMSEFYKYWIGGQEKRMAFARAQREVRKEFGGAASWASFVMIGL